MRSRVVTILLIAWCCTPASAAGPARVRFVAVSPALRASCRATARAVGYPVPCPTRVPEGLVGVGGAAGCSLSVIGPGLECPHTFASWRGWVVGSSIAGAQSLVLVASPHRLSSDPRLVDGPAWYPAARTRLLARIWVGARRMREVWVPGATNDGSSFSDHLALVFAAGGHSYAVGFLDVDGRAATLRLDRELAAGIRLVGAGR
jgi:hypothetical protein